ncbi:MAG: hypothetical protein ACLR76_03130 [Alistipes sp.]
MNIISLILPVALLLFAACSDRNAELAPDYFSGEVAGTSDSLFFRDCATSVDYLLSGKGAYRAVAARYGRLAGPRRRVYLACRAHVDSDTVSAGSGVRRLVVDRLIAFGEAGGCDWQYQLSGVYESDDPRHRQVLRLRPDRTFLLTRFGDGTESHTTGSWGLASELVLLLDCKAGSRMSFQLIPDRQALLSDDRTLSLRKCISDSGAAVFPLAVGAARLAGLLSVRVVTAVPRFIADEIPLRAGSGVGMRTCCR